MVFLALTFAVQCLGGPGHVRRGIYGIGILSYIGIGGALLYWVVALYISWKGSEIAKFFLPPYQSPVYFFETAWRFVGPWFLSGLAGSLLWKGAEYCNQKFGGRFLESGEAFLIGLGFFLSGYPGFLWYGAAMLALGLILSLIYEIAGWGRAPLYYWWVPVAMFGIILGNTVVPESLRTIFLF